MNLHGIAGPVIGVVNPNFPVSFQASLPYTLTPSGKQVPAYASAVTIAGQVQPMTARDLAQMDEINVGGVKWKIYLYGTANAVVRPEQKGGDLIVISNGPHQGTWLIAQVLEQFPDWCCCAIVQQNGG